MNSSMQNFINVESILEFDIIKEHISRLAHSEKVKKDITSLKPLSNKGIINKELDITLEAKQICDIYNGIPLFGYSDLRDILDKCKVKESYLFPDEFIKIADNLEAYKGLKSFVHKIKEDFPLLKDITKYLTYNENLLNEIRNKIDPEKRVRSNASEELKKIRNQINVKTGRLRERVNKILIKLAKKGMVQESIVTIKEGRMVIPLKEEFRKQFEGVIHHKSATGATLFVEPLEILEMNNEISELYAKEEKEVIKILKELTCKIRNNSEEIIKGQKILERVDFINAKALLSKKYDVKKPVPVQNFNLELIKACHPILLMKKEKSEIAPLDIKLGGKFNILLITGPNAGGKTVALKTVGLLSMMLQAGILIPASADSKIPVYKNIFAEIGDLQSIENDLSTFSSHISNLKNILNNSDRHSLVLIDEIGTGTDPNEGAAIAKAVLLELLKRRISTIATTHQSSLKGFAYETEGIENASMVFDPEKMQSTYKLRMGVPGSSYALEIAKKFGLDEKLIENAKQYLGSERVKFEDLIKQLEAKLESTQKELDYYTKKKSMAEGLEKLYQREKDKLVKDRAGIHKKAVEEAEEIVKQAGKAVEKAIFELKKKAASKESIKKAKEIVKEKKIELNKAKKKLRKTEKEKRDFYTDDLVTVKGTNYTGRIIQKSKIEDKVWIEIGNMKMEIATDKLKLQETEEKNTQSKDRIPDVYIENKLDLRGLDSIEALNKLENYLKEASIQELNKVYIIHGKGKMILQNKVEKYLKSCNFIESFRLGKPAEGGYGVTVVKIKTPGINNKTGGKE